MISRTALAWKPFFAQQVASLDSNCHIARVIAVQRTGLSIAPTLGEVSELPLGGRWFKESAEARPTVGDWLVIDPEGPHIDSILERSSLITRLSPAGEVQLIAANIDIAFIVTSCNADFSIARIERYLAAVLEADIQPVVVLTKVDLSDAVEPYLDAIRQLGRDIPVEAVNALSIEDCQGLAAWCDRQQSVALLGSSGVGKSTLVNTLAGEPLQATGAARTDDDKGRHTTTHRSLHLLAHDSVILDSPGMREFQLSDAQEGVSHAFDDIQSLARHCKFNDCKHDQEPGCAVLKALEDGVLDERRLHSYRKLEREARMNAETIAEQRARAKAFNKVTKAATLAAQHKRS